MEVREMLLMILGRLEKVSGDARMSIDAELAEWERYAADLRAMLKQRKVLDEKLPSPPGPVEIEIPF